MPNAEPDISLVFVTPDTYQTIRKTMQYVRSQSAADQCEVVIVCKAIAELKLIEEDMTPFHSFQVVERGPMVTTGPHRAAGVRAAKAPVIAFCEDHCYPQPGWAAAFLARHQEPWDAVGPSFGNANPWTLMSWTYIFMGFGPCINTTGGPGTYAPWHNTSYKKPALMAFGDRLDDALDIEGFLMSELMEKGGKMYLEPHARTHHLNTSKFGDWAPELFVGGRVYGARRSREWGIGRRAFHALTAGAIPLVRINRIIQHIKRAGQGQLLPRIIPTLFMGLYFHATGEFFGYAAGFGNSASQFAWTEIHREKRVRKSDIEKLRKIEAQNPALAAV